MSNIFRDGINYLTGGNSDSSEEDNSEPGGEARVGQEANSANSDTFSTPPGRPTDNHLRRSVPKIVVSMPDQDNAIRAAQLKKSLGGFKGHLTKVCNKIEDNLQTEKFAIQSTLKDSLKAAWQKVECNLEELILISDDTTDLENELEKYRDKFETAKTQQNTLFKKIEHAERPPDDRSLFSFGPRKIAKFDGLNPDEWLRFEQEFRILLKSYEGSRFVTDVERLSLLREHIIGEARKKIADLPLDAKNYKVALDKLQDLYGDKQASVRRIFARFLDAKKATGSNNGYNFHEIQRLSNLFENGFQLIKSSGIDAEEQHGMLMLIARRCFPTQLMSLFDDEVEAKVDQTHKFGTKATVQEFLDFVRRRVKTLYTNEPQIEHRKEEKKSENKKFSNSSGASLSTKNEPKCNLCEGKHDTQKCRLWQQETPSKLRNLLRAKKLCWNCGQEHRASDCKKQGCSKCGKKHHTVLCYDNADKRKGGRDKKYDKKSNATKRSEDQCPKETAKIQEVGVASDKDRQRSC